RPIGDALNGPAIERGERHGNEKDNQQRQWHGGYPERDEDEKGDQREERTDHENIAVGEIDHADDPVDHRVANGDQAIDRTERYAVDELLDEIFHASAAFRIPRNFLTGAFTADNARGGCGSMRQVLGVTYVLFRSYNSLTVSVVTGFRRFSFCRALITLRRGGAFPNKHRRISQCRTSKTTRNVTSSSKDRSRAAARAVKAASTAARTSPARAASKAAPDANATSLVAVARLNGGPLLFCAKLLSA